MKFARLGLIGAMTEEIELVEKNMTVTARSGKAGITFIEGQFHNHFIVLCKSGVGKVNAAVCTQLLVDLFAVDTVIFTGVAGALDPELEVGDIVVSSECMQHDMDASALGFPKGTIPYQEVSVFSADETLISLALEAGRKVFHGRVKLGRVLSGDQFIADRNLVSRLRNELHGACAEMEGAAVAQVCSMNQIPFVIIRSMSDKADGSAHVSFAEFTVQASENSYRIVDEIVKLL